MRIGLRHILMASSLACLATATVSLSGTVGFAQTKPAPQSAQPADDQNAPPPVEQAALTEKQVQAVLASQKDFTTVTAKIPEAAAGAPDPKVVAEIDAVAKKYGFVDYASYDKIAANIGFVLSGFDPESKTFVGPDVVIKKEIAQIKADKQMPAKDKTAALAEMNDTLKTVKPVQFPDNIKIVTKYYDKLVAAFQQE